MSTNDSFIKQWSKIPASNGIAPNIVPYGWPEGQPPSSVNNCARQAMADHRYQWEDAEWFCRGEGSALSKASATSFKITGDVTSDYHEDRRIKIFDSTTKYATITSSTYSAPDTTVNLLFDDGASLGSSLSAVALSILSADHTALPRGNIFNKNFVIGGNFDTNPWQRQTTFAAAASGQYTADRFVWIFSGTGVVTIQKTADAPTGSQAGIFTSNCLDISTTTAETPTQAADYFILRHMLEGYDFAQIAHQPMTLSFWVKATVTGIYSFMVYPSGSDAYYIAEYTINASNTWEYKTITIPASNPASGGTWNYTNGLGLALNWVIACGANYVGTVGAWTYSSTKLCSSNQVNGMDSNSNHFKIALIQLEPGEDATAFEVEPVSRTLAKCQRYYEKSYDQGTYAGATNVAGVQGLGIGAVTAGIYQGSVIYQVEKCKTSPTLTLYGHATGTAGKATQDDGSDVNISQSFNGMNGFAWSVTNAVSRKWAFFQFTSDAEL